jgi:hypothetical protein
LFYSAWMAYHFVLYFCFILFSEVFHIMFNIVNFCPEFIYLSVYGGLSFSLMFI